MPEKPPEAAELPPDITLQQIAFAYIESLLNDQPMHNPVFETIGNVNGKWLRVQFTAKHEWLDKVPDEVLAIMPAQGEH